MKLVLLFALFVLVLACSGPVTPEYSLTTAELERLYQTDRANADQQYTGRGIKVAGTVDSAVPIEGGTLLTFKPSSNTEVLCRFDKPIDLTPGQSITVAAINMGLEQKYIKLFNCSLIK